MTDIFDQGATDTIFALIARGRVLRALRRARRDEVRNHLTQERRARDLDILVEGSEFAHDWYLLRHEDALWHQIERVRGLTA